MGAVNLRGLLLFVCLLLLIWGLSLFAYCFSLFVFSNHLCEKRLFCHLSARSGTASIFEVGRHNGNLALEKPE